ncbi:uncharacterized protein [Cardiocondyla obscurior]|uniref:uncharacterized protein n=1 Tax=Cardiocondyla obscurior TaxID=286306 RepID=UPI0039656D80
MDRNVNVINTSSRCVNTSCKLINGLKEKRETMQRSPNLICEKSSGDNATHDNVSLQRKISKKESRKAESIQEMNVKVNDGNVWCKDTTSSTKDGHYCENTCDVDFPQRDLSSSIAPCSSFSVCDGARQTQPSITQHPSKTRARLDDREVFISRTICTDAERRDHYKNKDRRNVGGDDNELRFADDRICRNKTLQESIMERNNILKRMERKLLQSFERWQREQVAREWSTCSCIVEKDEDYYASIDGVEKELPEDTRNVAECPGKVFARRTSSKTLTEGTEFSEKDFEIIRKNHLKGTNIDETRFKNSAEPSSKATKVCMESVLEEPSKDIAVSKTVLGEPNRLTEEVIVYKTALSDSKDTPKEITRKEIPDSNSVGQSDVNRLSLNDMKNKFAGENVNSSNSNSLEEKAEEMKVKLIDKPDNDTLNFASQQTAAIIDITVPKNRTVPKLLRIIAEKKSHNIPTTVDFKFEEPKVESTPDKIITTIHVDQEKIPEEKAILKEHASVEIVEEIKTNDSIASEMRVNTIETNAEDDSSKEESDKDEVFKDIQDETTEIHVTCPQKEPEEESQKPILYKCGLPSDSNTDACSIAKCAKDCANQGNPEEEPQKSTLCKRDLAFILNNYAYSIVKCTKCDNIIGGCAYKDNRFEWKKMYCVCCLLTTQCTCAPHSKSYLKIDKPKFHDVSPLTIGPHICRSCCKESECRKMKMYAHEECKYRRSAIRGDCSRINEHER